MRARVYSYIAFILILAALLSACGGNELLADSPDKALDSAEADAPTAATRDVPEPVAFIADPDGSTFAEEKRVASGDNFAHNLYERPFTAVDMRYQPDVDIQQAAIASDEDFFYFTIMLKDVNAETGSLTGIYGIELDRSKDGRGDLLVTVQSVADDWSPQNIHVYTDPNTDVGGPNPTLPDEGFSGSGYEGKIELAGNKLAYASLFPGHANIIQIALSRAVLEDASEFLWGAWADKGVDDPSAFDYNDRYTAGQAGSPVAGSPNYPLAELANVDNTCRQAFGFTPQGSIPGSCLVVPPAESPKKGIKLCCPAPSCCEFPEACCGDRPVPPPPEEEQEQEEPVPEGCEPRKVGQAGDCAMQLKTTVECDGVNDIVTIDTPGVGIMSFNAGLADYTCDLLGDIITCTGPKQDPGTPLTVELCTTIVPDQVANCRDFPNTYYNQDLGICLPLGSSCCQIGEEWYADEGRCVPIVTGDGKATQETCGDAYQLVQGYCVFQGILDTCCTTVEINAPCCYTACVPGYELDANLCCVKKQESKSTSCAGVNCDRCTIAKTCPPGCCN